MQIVMEHHIRAQKIYNQRCIQDYRFVVIWMKLTSIDHRHHLMGCGDRFCVLLDPVSRGHKLIIIVNYGDEQGSV